MKLFATCRNLLITFLICNRNVLSKHKMLNKISSEHILVLSLMGGKTFILRLYKKLGTQSRANSLEVLHN